MAELTPITTAPTAPTTPINTATPPRSAAAKPNEATRLSKRLGRHYDRLYLLSTLGHLAIESLDYNTDTDTARATLTGMVEMLASDFEEIQSLIDLAGGDTDASLTPAGMEA